MNKETYQEWRNTSATVEVFAELDALKHALTDTLANGNTLSTTADETALLTARIVGKIDGLNQILGMDYEDGEVMDEK